MAADLVERIEDMHKVVELLAKGYNPMQISKQLKITRKNVLEHIESWKKYVAQDVNVTERAKETLLMVDEHYAMIIKKMWETVEQADQASNLVVKSSTLKNLAGVEKDRADLFQKAGLTDQSDLAAQIAEGERKQEILVKILEEVTGKCNHCKFEVKRRLSDYMNKSVVIEEEDITSYREPVPEKVLEIE